MTDLAMVNDPSKFEVLRFDCSLDLPPEQGTALKGANSFLLEKTSFQKSQEIKESKQHNHKRNLPCIKALTALMDRLPWSVGLKNGPERGFKMVSFNL